MLVRSHDSGWGAGRRTDDEGNHGGSISPGGLKALYELLHLPYFNVLLSVVGLLSRAHTGEATLSDHSERKDCGGREKEQTAGESKRKTRMERQKRTIYLEAGQEQSQIAGEKE